MMHSRGADVEMGGYDSGAMSAGADRKQSILPSADGTRGNSLMGEAELETRREANEDDGADPDSDPIVAEYDVYITPELPHGAQLYWMQYPNREREKPYLAREEPTEVRIKPKSGFMEVDVPLNVRRCYDRTKGVIWGEALRETREHNITSFGLAAGFNRAGNRPVPPPPAEPGSRTTLAGSDRGSHRERRDERIERLVRNFNVAHETGHVLNKQTLGGQISRHHDGSSIYMTGAFRGSQLHLTPINGRVELRPQFHYLDAQNRLSSARSRSGQPLDAPHSFMISQRNVRVPVGEEEVSLLETNSLLKAAADEQWQKLKYFPATNEQAFDDYEHLFYPESETTPSPLAGNMTQDEYLNWISCPTQRAGKENYGKTPKQIAEEAAKKAEDEQKGESEKNKRRG